MVWTELLRDSQIAFLNSIIDQVPQEMGARDAFITILQDLADKARPAKFKYYRVSIPDGNVTGIDDENVALETAESEEDFVIDVATNEWIQADGDRQDIKAD